jgi:hypothetical protein
VALDHAYVEARSLLIQLDNGDEMHTVPEAASAFRVSERNIRRWINAAGIEVLHGHVSYLALARAERAAEVRNEAARFQACP